MATQASPVQHNSTCCLSQLSSTCCLDKTTLLKTALVALALLCIGSAVVIGGGWSQALLPQLFTTTSQQIISTWALGVAGLGIGLAVLEWSIIQRVQAACPKRTEPTGTSSSSTPTLSGDGLTETPGAPPQLLTLVGSDASAFSTPTPSGASLTDIFGDHPQRAMPSSSSASRSASSTESSSSAEADELVPPKDWKVAFNPAIAQEQQYQKVTASGDLLVAYGTNLEESIGSLQEKLLNIATLGHSLNYAPFAKQCKMVAMLTTMSNRNGTYPVLAYTNLGNLSQKDGKACLSIRESDFHAGDFIQLEAGTHTVSITKADGSEVVTLSVPQDDETY